MYLLIYIADVDDGSDDGSDDGDDGSDDDDDDAEDNTTVKTTTTIEDDHTEDIRKCTARCLNVEKNI